jgi:DNA-binding PadR family transcriptional regulator
MRYVELLTKGGYVIYNKKLAKETTITATILYSQLCISYDSFKNKGMITKSRNKEYFFLTSNMIQEETALGYKQQKKAIIDLEEAGYIETILMGMPSKKYFHITDKIFETFQDDQKSKPCIDNKDKLNNQKVHPLWPNGSIMNDQKGHLKLFNKNNNKNYSYINNNRNIDNVQNKKSMPIKNWLNGGEDIFQ